MTSLDSGATGRRPRGAARKKARKKKTTTNETKKTHEPPEGSPLMTIPKAGKWFFGLSKNGSYDAAERGDFGPLLEIGGGKGKHKRKFVVVAAIEAKIKAAAEAQQRKANAA
jgi:hypothetical protein